MKCFAWFLRPIAIALKSNFNLVAFIKALDILTIFADFAVPKLIYKKKKKINK